MISKGLDQQLNLRGTIIKNRICFSAMACTVQTNKDGIIKQTSVDMYRSIAKGGAALIVQGATSVCKVNRYNLTQAGIWCDQHIKGLSKITEAIHSEGKKIFIQLQHAGIRSHVAHPLCPSEFDLKTRSGIKTGKVMTVKDINKVIQEFVDASKRAVAAGYDGIEIQGSHGWLLSNFLNRRINNRVDIYGLDPILLIREIYEEVRNYVSKNFVIGIRINGFEPDLASGIENAKKLDELGIDFISVSNNDFWPEQEITKPDDFQYSANVYAAGEVKKAVNAKVFATKGIRTIADANAIITNTDVDMIQIGRGMLIDPEWANKVLSGEEPGKCLWCKGCKWRSDITGANCPGYQLLKKKRNKLVF